MSVGSGEREGVSRGDKIKTERARVATKLRTMVTYIDLYYVQNFKKVQKLYVFIFLKQKLYVFVFIFKQVVK